MGSLQRQPTLVGQQTSDSIKWKLEGLSASVGADRPFGSVNLDELLSGIEADTYWEQQGPAPVPDFPEHFSDSQEPDLRGRSVEEVWSAIQQTSGPGGVPAHDPPPEQPDRESSWLPDAFPVDASCPPQQASRHTQPMCQPEHLVTHPMSHPLSHAMRHQGHAATAAAAPQPSPYVQQGAQHAGSAQGMPQEHAPYRPAAASGRGMPNAAAMEPPGMHARASTQQQLHWGGHMADQPAAALAAATTANTPVPGRPIAAAGAAAGPEGLPVPLPGYPANCQQLPQGSTGFITPMPLSMLAPLQVPRLNKNAQHAAGSQLHTADHDQTGKAGRTKAPKPKPPPPLSGQPQMGPPSKVFRPVTPPSPSALQAGGQASSGAPAARAARKSKRKEAEPPTDERQAKRMVKNRESAARSRMRKQAYTSELESQVEDLRQENKDLLEKVIKACPPPVPKHMPMIDGEALRRTRTTPM